MIQVGPKFFAFVSLPSLPAPSFSLCPLALSQELSSSTESIDNSFSSVSGARLGLGGRLPPWPHFLSVPRPRLELKGAFFSWEISFSLPGLPGLPDLGESPACRQCPEPRLSGAQLVLFPGTAGMRCVSVPSSWVSRANSWESCLLYTSDAADEDISV